jgi:hypothetical protein
MTATDTHRAIDAVWRIESARLIAGLARMVRDVGLAEDLAQDALVAALEQWPESGVPDNPGAWLMATAKHRAIDGFRRSKRLDRKHETLGHEIEARQEEASQQIGAAIDDEIGSVYDIYFDAQHWTVRYFVVDTGTWLSGRRVLVSPMSLRNPADVVGDRLNVGLSRSQIEQAPSWDTDKPVSRQHEIAYSQYYAYPYYWAGPAR